MQSSAIRAQFIQFFQQKGHQHQIAAPIVNKEDPSLLFVNAGMNPFKDIILGYQPIQTARVVSAQPCLRVSGKHNDLEAVGVDGYHHTLFEMLGNWSFGDYFKEAAIQWAWELLTEVYQLPKERLYVTTFAGDPEDNLPEDKETVAIWRNYLPPTHILPFAKKDNFWEMGTQGPCGPCSEIHIDIRPEATRQSIAAAQLVNQENPQVLEVWNLVFMQYNRKNSGKLVELPHKHIDTGMGLERLAMVLQGKMATYDTDIFTPLIQAIEKISGKAYADSTAIAAAMRVVADHLRAVAFAIADGALPAATKTGYVLRRILRRAIRYGYSCLAIEEPFIYQLVAPLVAQMGDAYPNLRVQQTTIEEVIQAEEKAFLKTLAAGLQRLHYLNPQGTLAGKVAFELYDSYGFPLDLTKLIAKEKNLILDEAGFEVALQAQQARSQQDAAVTYGDWHQLQPGVTTRFVGYDQLTATTSIVQWRSLTDKRGKRYQLVLAVTPFYPAGGGQVADKGSIHCGTESIAVLDVQKEHGLLIHTVDRLPDPIEGTIEACVDEPSRKETAANHTATHLLQAALRTLLGKQLSQKGSLVTASALRFDFTHAAKLTAAQIEAIEAMVNAKIRANIPCLEQRDLPLEMAKARGAQALFGEKYAAEVRVITFDEKFSMELCGGTHVKTTGEIGFFKIIRETAIGSGIRRIEALTAHSAAEFVNQELTKLVTLSTLLRQPKDIVKVVDSLLHEKKQLEKQCQVYETHIIQQVTQQLSLEVEQVGDAYLLIQAVILPHLDALRQVAFQFKARYKKIFIVLATELSHKAHLLILRSEALAATCNAHLLMQSIAPLIKGKGGGQPFFATAGGSNPAAIPVALQMARQLFLDASFAT
ncbi:MAG: alanine--tRNA ligase [Candidatus Cardinium sp.]|nr:alanine--tRNA ligase [Candidatus Cardinium sp.]